MLYAPRWTHSVRRMVMVRQAVDLEDATTQPYARNS